MRMVPRSIAARPFRQRSSVDLPEPDGPMMQTASPFAMSNEMPLSTSASPKALWMSLTAMYASVLNRGPGRCEYVRSPPADLPAQAGERVYGWLAIHILTEYFRSMATVQRAIG